MKGYGAVWVVRKGDLLVESKSVQEELFTAAAQHTS